MTGKGLFAGCLMPKGYKFKVAKHVTTQPACDCEEATLWKPGNIVQYKLLGSVIAPVKEVAKVRRRVDDEEELVGSDTEDSDSEDNTTEGSESELDSEGYIKTVNGSLKGGLIIGGVLTAVYLIKRRWVNQRLKD